MLPRDNLFHLAVGIARVNMLGDDLRGGVEHAQQVIRFPSGVHFNDDQRAGVVTITRSTLSGTRERLP